MVFMKTTLLLLLVGVSFLNALQLASENTSFEKDESKQFKKIIKVRNSVLEQKEQSKCTLIELDRDVTQYITEIKIRGRLEVNHHITLMAANKIVDDYEPPEVGNTVDCRGYIFDNYYYNRRLYTWALNADGVKYEDGVGIKVSGETGLYFLIMQIHYNDQLPIGFVDNYTAYELTMTTQDLPYQVGVYTIGDSVSDIPPRTEKYYMDSACPYTFNYEIVPIFYRTHAHIIIPVISGYLIRNEEWIELGRMSPYQPQQFYPVTNKDLIIGKGDYIAARCTANSMERDFVTHQGSKHVEEMCAFYLQFYTDYKGDLNDKYCYADERYTFENDLPIKTSPPENSDNLVGVHLIRPDYELKSHKKEHQ